MKFATFNIGNEDKNSIAISTQQITAIKHPYIHRQELSTTKHKHIFKGNQLQLIQIYKQTKWVHTAIQIQR